LTAGEVVVVVLTSSLIMTDWPLQNFTIL